MIGGWIGHCTTGSAPTSTGGISNAVFVRVGSIGAVSTGASANGRADARPTPSRNGSYALVGEAV
jgi:hypothetical protein